MFIDSSIFLEVFLKQEKSQECKDFLQKVIDGSIRCFTSYFNIDSILLVIQNKTKDIKLMENFLLSLLAYSGLTIYFLTIEDRLKALEHSKKYNLDFEDSMMLQATLGSGNTKIISFDRHFDNLPVERLEPKDIV